MSAVIGLVNERKKEILQVVQESLLSSNRILELGTEHARSVRLAMCACFAWCSAMGPPGNLFSMTLLHRWMQEQSGGLV